MLYVTKSMEQRSSSCQEIPYGPLPCTQDLPLDIFLGQINPVYILIIYLRSILILTTRIHLSLFRFSSKILYACFISLIPLEYTHRIYVFVSTNCNLVNLKLMILIKALAKNINS
jgi:hypothetical protein